VTRLEPAVIEALKDVRCSHIAAGRNHSMVVSEDGHLYAWGSNEHGQLGMDVPVGPFPARMRFCKGFFFRGVAVSKCHTVAWGVTRKGSVTPCVWTFGANHGQLGFQRKVRAQHNCS
jgi:alpha-tubulin suppressor-like RCC1 family protein